MDFCVKVIREPLRRVVDDILEDYTERFYFNSFNEALDKYEYVMKHSSCTGLCSFGVEILRFFDATQVDVLVSFHIEVLVVDVLLKSS